MKHFIDCIKKYAVPTKTIFHIKNLQITQNEKDNNNFITNTSYGVSNKKTYI